MKPHLITHTTFEFNGVHYQSKEDADYASMQYSAVQKLTSTKRNDFINFAHQMLQIAYQLHTLNNNVIEDDIGITPRHGALVYTINPTHIHRKHHIICDPIRRALLLYIFEVAGIPYIVYDGDDSDKISIHIYPNKHSNIRTYTHDELSKLIDKYPQ